MPSKGTPSEQTTSDEMLTSGEGDSEEHSEVRPSGLVYDFLYQDVRRVGSFLAQFEDYGVRQSVKATESVGQSQMVKGVASGTVGLPAVMGGSASIDTATTDETKDLAEHTFDPLWANARRLLDYLEAGASLQSDLWSARIGSFVQIAGSVAVVDLQYIQAMLQNPSLKRGLLENFYKTKNTRKGSEQSKDFERNLELVASLPHGIQLTIYADEPNDNVVAWSSVSLESLTSTAADLMLKHGVIIRGTWKVIGIMDAYPDMPYPTEVNPTAQTLDEVAIEGFQKDFTKMAAGLAAAARELIGRPRTMFGVTPILIFREVNGGD